MFHESIPETVCLHNCGLLTITKRLLIIIKFLVIFIKFYVKFKIASEILYFFKILEKF